MSAGDKVDEHSSGVIFETADRRKAVLYRVLLPKKGEEDMLPFGPTVLVVTVDFQSLNVVTYEPPIDLGEKVDNPHSYKGCERLD